MYVEETIYVVEDDDDDDEEETAKVSQALDFVSKICADRLLIDSQKKQSEMLFVRAKP